MALVAHLCHGGRTAFIAFDSDAAGNARERENESMLGAAFGARHGSYFGESSAVRASGATSKCD